MAECNMHLTDQEADLLSRGLMRYKVVFVNPQPVISKDMIPKEHRSSYEDKPLVFMDQLENGFTNYVFGYKARNDTSFVATFAIQCPYGNIGDNFRQDAKYYKIVDINVMRLYELEKMPEILVMTGMSMNNVKIKNPNTIKNLDTIDKFVGFAKSESTAIVNAFREFWDDQAPEGVRYENNPYCWVMAFKQEQSLIQVAR